MEIDLTSNSEAQRKQDSQPNVINPSNQQDSGPSFSNLQKQQPQSTNTNKDEQKSNKQINKLIPIAIVVVAILFMGFLITRGIKRSIQGTTSKTVKTTHSIASKQSKGIFGIGGNTKEESTVLEEEVETEMEKLRKEISTLKAENEVLKQKAESIHEVTGMPQGITSLTEMSSKNPSALNHTRMRTYRELIPYVKKNVKLPTGDYSFVLQVRYGNHDYMLPIQYKDFAVLKPEGVIAVNVEVTNVRDDSNERSSNDIVTYIGIEPNWRKYVNLN